MLGRFLPTVKGSAPIERAGMGLLVVIGVLAPLILGSSVFRLGQLDYILALTMMTVGMNIVLGFAGQLFLGPTALFAVSAYLAAYLAEHHSLAQSLPAMCVVGVVASIIVAAVAAVPSLRVGGFYLGMVTLFLALVIPTVFGRMNAFGASDGISLVLVQSFTQRPSGVALYEVGVALVLFLTLMSWMIRRSRLGRRLSAVRSGDVLAQAVGVAPYRTKMVAFLLGAVPCGIAGAYYVYSQQFITSGSAQPTLSIDVLAGLVIGGTGTIAGPFIGTAIVAGANQFLGGFHQYQGVVFGLLLIAVAIALPEGVVGTLKKLTARVGPRRAVASSVEAPDLAGLLAGLGRRAGPAVLQVKDVRRAFGGVRALDGVSLRVEPGRIHALVGPNGSGKTTLLNVICGYYGLQGGEIWFGDRRIDGSRPETITRTGIARTFQTPKLLLSEAALENVVLGSDQRAAGSLWAAAVGTPRARRADAESRRQALACVGIVGLRPADLVENTVSHGAQRMVEIARVLATGAGLVLLDEPAAGLSVAEVEVLKTAVRSLAEAGLGVVLVEHNLPVVFGLADVVTVLNRGEVIAHGTPLEVSGDPEVARVYLGRQRGAAERDGHRTPV